MKVLGAYVRVKDKRYLAGFAVVDDLALADVVSLPAPADRDEPGQLADLLTTATDLASTNSLDAVAIRAYENQSRQQLQISDRAEGVIIAAAGIAGRPVTRFVTASLWKPAGFQKSAKAAASRDALCAQLSSAPPSVEEIQQAASAARALIVRES